MLNEALEDNEIIILSVIKLASTMANLIVVSMFGLLPVRIKRFKLNHKYMSSVVAFNGGLLLNVALILLLPRANFFMRDHMFEQFPLPFVIATISFAVILLIEKVVPNDIATDKSTNSQVQVYDPLLVNLSVEQLKDTDEDTFKRLVSPKIRMAQQLGYVQKNYESMVRGEEPDLVVKQWNIYTLQLSMTIQAVLEGMVLGISQNIGNCAGLSIAILIHKCTEGVTFGHALRKAQVKKDKSTKLVILQSFMTPLGIAIGWMLSDESEIVQGVIYSIATGPFLYVSSVDILQEEFAFSRDKVRKFMFTALSSVLVVGIWLLENQIGE